LGEQLERVSSIEQSMSRFEIKAEEDVTKAVEGVDLARVELGRVQGELGVLNVMAHHRLAAVDASINNLALYVRHVHEGRARGVGDQLAQLRALHHTVDVLRGVVTLYESWVDRALGAGGSGN
jgi:hypothetical protein